MIKVQSMKRTALSLARYTSEIHFSMCATQSLQQV